LAYAALLRDCVRRHPAFGNRLFQIVGKGSSVQHPHHCLLSVWRELREYFFEPIKPFGYAARLRIRWIVL
jgi:hypothetical protein